MKTVAIIAEYNPFHNGHEYQLRTISQYFTEMNPQAADDVVRVVIQSGPFVQRGTPALLDTFTRAEMAVLGGADVVVELPTLFATGSAEIFGTGGVRLAHGLGADYLAFGAEPQVTTEEPISTLLMKLAQHTTTEDYEQAVQKYLKKKVFYGTALTKALTDAYPEAAALLDKPNALLGLEYCKAIVRHAPNMEPITIERNSDYNTTDLNSDNPSATAIRAQVAKILHDDDMGPHLLEQLLAAMPKNVQDKFMEAIFQGALTDEERFFDFVLLESRLASESSLEELADFGEGLASLWHRSSMEPTWDALVKEVKSKRYSYARLQRMAAYLLLRIKADVRRDAHFTGPTYTRLLAFNDKGRKWLKATEETRTIPIINKWAPFAKHPEKTVGEFNAPLAATSIAIDQRATAIQRLCFVNTDYRRGDSYLLYGPRYLK